MNKLGVLGDVHTEDDRLARALREFERASVDTILCSGDVVDGTGSVTRAIDLLVSADAHVVAGNHERWLLSGAMRSLPNATLELDDLRLRIIAGWPTTLDFETPRGGLRLAHGVGDDDMAELRPDTKGYALQAVTGLREMMLDATVSFHMGGHTHTRMVRVFPGLVTLNAGTLEGDEPTAVIVDFEARTVTFLDLRADGALPLETRDLPDPGPIDVPA